jgi:hypothetical protein
MKIEQLNAEAFIVKRTWTRVYFTASSPGVLNQKQLGEVQKILGYDPMGYFGPTRIESKHTGLEYKYRWECSANCD